MEISNKTLAWLVMATIIVSIGGTIISLNKLEQGIAGYATSNATGTASVTVSTQTVLRFAAGTSSMDFGTGSADSSSGNHTCNMSVNGSTGLNTNQFGCNGFNSAVTGGAFVLENAGTTLMNVTLNFSSNASTFIGGVNYAPLLQYAISENETGSCGAINATLMGWTSVVQQAVIPICTNLNFSDTRDSLMIGIKIAVPEDAPTGAKQLNITAQGTG